MVPPCSVSGGHTAIVMVLSSRAEASMTLFQALVFSAKRSIIAELLFDLK